MPVPDLPNTPDDRSTSRSRFSVIFTPSMSSGAPMWKKWTSFAADLALALGPEDLVDLLLAGRGHRREVLRHRLDRLRLAVASFSRISSGLRWTVPKVVVPRWISAMNGSL